MKKTLFILFFMVACAFSASAQTLVGKYNVLDTANGETVQRWKKMYDYSISQSDDTTISTNLTATELSIKIGAGEIWHFDMYGMDSVSAATGVQFADSIPTGAIISGIEQGSKKSDTLGIGVISADMTAGTTFTTYVPTTNYAEYTQHFTVDNTSGIGGPVIVYFKKPTSGKAILKKYATLLGFRTCK